MIENHIECAWTAVRTNTPNSNAERSANWVKLLAQRLRTQYQYKAGYRVFSRDYTGNKKAFKLQEYLFDITVIRTGKVASPRGVSLEYPAETIWHVESEFHQTNSRESIVDFGKLLMSSAKHKLMVLPAGGGIQTWAKHSLPQLRDSPLGTMHLCFLPHPDKWGQSQADAPQVFQIW